MRFRSVTLMMGRCATRRRHDKRIGNGLRVGTTNGLVKLIQLGFYELLLRTSSISFRSQV